MTKPEIAYKMLVLQLLEANLQNTDILLNAAGHEIGDDRALREQANDMLEELSEEYKDAKSTD